MVLMAKQMQETHDATGAAVAGARPAAGRTNALAAAGRALLQPGVAVAPRNTGNAVGLGRAAAAVAEGIAGPAHVAHWVAVLAGITRSDTGAAVAEVAAAGGVRGIAHALICARPDAVHCAERMTKVAGGCRGTIGAKRAGCQAHTRVQHGPASGALAWTRVGALHTLRIASLAQRLARLASLVHIRLRRTGGHARGVGGVRAAAAIHQGTVTR